MEYHFKQKKMNKTLYDIGDETLAAGLDLKKFKREKPMFEYIGWGNKLFPELFDNLDDAKEAILSKLQYKMDALEAQIAIIKNTDEKNIPFSPDPYHF